MPHADISVSRAEVVNPECKLGKVFVYKVFVYGFVDTDKPGSFNESVVSVACRDRSGCPFVCVDEGPVFS